MKIIIGLLSITLIAALTYIFLPQTELARGRPRDLTQVDSRPPAQATAQCITSAATVYQVPPDVMFGILSVEGGHSGQAVGPNVNGTYDLGLMQINSLWVPQLARIWHVDYQTAYDGLRDSSCANIYAGAWILKQKIIETGTLYSGIASYHSTTHAPGIFYANKVIMTTQRSAQSLPR